MGVNPAFGHNPEASPVPQFAATDGAGLKRVELEGIEPSAESAQNAPESTSPQPRRNNQRPAFPRNAMDLLAFLISIKIYYIRYAVSREIACEITKK